MTITGPRIETAPPADSAPTPSAPVVPANSTRVGVGVNRVELDTPAFWGRMQDTNRTATLDHCLSWMERLGWIENFDRVARGQLTTNRPGWQFSDSEVYKLLEAMAWELGRAPDDHLQGQYNLLVERVSAAQDDDGYLNTAFGHLGLPDRYTDMAMGHELYNIGHLLQAAVARLRTHGPDTLTETARKAADHVCRIFGADGHQAVCGHPEIEVGLTEFARATGDGRYLRQATLFLERRGHGTLPVRPLLSAEYFQDDIPIRSADVLRGHAVRALYLSSAAVDAAVDNDDVELLDALERQWARTVERRTYLTGGMGSRHQDEGFGDDYELPADRAYCETCAGIGSVMFAWRLYLATGSVRYVDLIERTLFNIIATSPRDDGRAFFYANPLHQREAGDEPVDGVNTRAEGGSRAPWFEVSCCPTNVARTLASLATYAAAEDDGAAVLLQYMTGRYAVADFEFRVETAYPVEGSITILIDAAPEDGLFRLRIPNWSETSTVTVAGRSPQAVAPGWVDIHSLQGGDTIEIQLDVTPRVTWPDPRIDAVRGTVAVERGPIVLCAEAADLPAGATLNTIRVSTEADPVSYEDGAQVDAHVVSGQPLWSGRLPFGARPDAVDIAGFPLTLIPYHRWAERGPTSMRVFLPLAVERRQIGP